jgi:hypothetical protein
LNDPVAVSHSNIPDGVEAASDAEAYAPPRSVISSGEGCKSASRRDRRAAPEINPNQTGGSSRDKTSLEAALKSHRETPHFKKYAETTAKMVAKRDARPMSVIASNSQAK